MTAAVLMNLNYYQPLIAVADDCPVTASTPPPDRGGAKSVAALQYDMLAGRPFVFTQEDVLFEVWRQRQGGPAASPEEVAELRAAFFAKPQACLRASPMPKRYGWGFLFDREGRVALCPMESAEYRKQVVGGGVTIVKAMRSKRAP